MVSITAIESKTVDGVIFNELATSVFRDTNPRVTRTPTLDGGAVIDHRGFIDGDRIFKIEAALDEATTEALWTLYRNETIVHISCIEGFFTGTLAKLKADGGRVTLIFWVKE